jgi:hypothetical protein
MDNQKITKHSRATLCDPALPRKSKRRALTGGNRGKGIQFYGSPNSVAQLIGINGLKTGGRGTLARAAPSRLTKWRTLQTWPTSGQDSSIIRRVSQPRIRIELGAQPGNPTSGG